MKINSLDELKIIDIPVPEWMVGDMSSTRLMYNNKIFICNLSINFKKEIESNEILFEMDLPFNVSYRYVSQLSMVMGKYPIQKRNPTICAMIKDGKFIIMSNDKITLEEYGSLTSFWYIGQLVGFIDN